jgi:hypothetical protein
MARVVEGNARAERVKVGDDACVCCRPWHKLLGRLWHKLLGRPASENGRLCHGNGGHQGGARCRRALVLTILYPLT